MHFVRRPLLLLACWILALPAPPLQAAQALHPGAAAFALARAAESADALDLAASGDRAALRAYRQQLVDDRDRTLRALAPLFRTTSAGWLDCSRARAALSDALDTTQTVAGLEMIVAMGVRTEEIHCHRVGAADAWVGRIQAGSDRIARGLPVGFTHTAQALDYLQPLDWLRAGERQAVPGPTGCMARKMAASRRRGQDYQSALTQAVAGCPSAP